MNHLIQQVKDEVTKLETMFRASRFEVLREKLAAIFSHPAVIAAGLDARDTQTVIGGPVAGTFAVGVIDVIGAQA